MSGESLRVIGGTSPKPLAPLRGAISTASGPGGLRCAPTTGYFLETSGST